MTTYWAISSIGYGKGETVEDAVNTHDEIQQRNYRHMLAVPVTEIPLIVWEPPEGIDGFYLAGEVTWTSSVDDFEGESNPVDIRAARGQSEYFWAYVAEEGLTVERLDASVEA